jgi:single-stranded-DNA-specific exonuclease
VAVVNPKQEECSDLELRELAGAGVAFKVAQGLAKAGLISAGQEKWLLDLVAIGTVCDCMNLASMENRRLVYWGYRVLARTRRKGLKELMRIAGVKRVSSFAIGFLMGPRLNASGRIEKAYIALKLLLSESSAEAAKLAGDLETLNDSRKRRQNEGILEIEEKIEADDSVICALGKWHEGVIGIMAGRILEKYQKPTIVFTEVEDGFLKASGRSFGEFDLSKLWREVVDLLVKGGGHAAAAGATIRASDFSEFRRRANEYYKSLRLRDQARFLVEKVDLEISDFGEVSIDFYDEMKELEPFG